MSLPSARMAEIEARVKSEQNASDPSTQSYLQDTPDDQVLSDPRALADIRDYYRKWKGRYFADDKEMLEEFHEDQSWNNLNTVGAGINWAESSSANEEQRAHMARMSSLYHKVPMLNSKGGFADKIGGFNVAANIGQSVLADPLNLIGFGAGAAVGKAAARGAVAVGESGMRAGVKAAAKKGALVEGLVAAPVGVGIDALTQGYQQEVGLQDEYSVAQGAMAGGIGLVAGGVLGGIMAAFSGAWGARIGTKQAQRLLDEGYTPESIPMMTQKEVDFALTPEGATAKLETETQAAYDQRAELEATESSQLDAMEAQRAEMDAADRKVPVQEAISWADKDDYDVLTGAIDRVQAKLDQTTNPVGRKPLVAQINLLNRSRVKLRNGAARQAEIDEELKTASGKAQEALFKESEELADLKESVIQIRNSLQSSQNAAEPLPTTRVPITPAEVLPTPKAEVADPISPATVPEPTVAPANGAKESTGTAEPNIIEEALNAPEGLEPTAAPALAVDVVEAAVPEAAPVANQGGRPRGDLTNESVALLKELGVEDSVIDKAKASKKPIQRKKLMKQIIESYGLAVDGEDLNKVNIGNLAARIKAYTDEQAATNAPVAPATPVAPASALDDAARTIDELTAPDQRPVDPVDGPDYTTAQMESDMLTMDDKQLFEEINGLIGEPTPSRVPEETAPVAPTAETVAEVPSSTPKANDPAPIPFEEIDSTNLSDLGITPEDNTVLFNLLMAEGELSPMMSPSTIGKITIAQFDLMATKLTSKKWSRTSTSMKKRIDNVRVIEEMRQKLMPNGIVKNTQSRKKAVAEIRNKFKSHGTVFVDNAVALFDRFGDLGYSDVAPIFSNNAGRSEGTWDGFATRNKVSISTGDGLHNPKLATFYHEVAHWMYGNVLTPGQKIEFMESMGKYYKEDGSLDVERIAEALPLGKEARIKSGQYAGQYASTDGMIVTTNADYSPQEFFAESFALFSMRSHASPDAQLQTFFQKVQVHFKYLYQRFIKQSGIVDPDLERLFINIIPNEKQHRDLLTENVVKVSLKDGIRAKTPTGEAIRMRLSNANLLNSEIEESLDSTSIINKMKDLGVEFFSLTSERSPTGKFRQVSSMYDELRQASEGIYAAIREKSADDKGKLGELTTEDWGEIEAGIKEMPQTQMIEIADLLAAQWETGGIRELVHKLDDTLRAQYFRNEQELILSGMAKDSFPDTLEKYRDGFKIKLAWQKKKPEIRNPTLVTWENQAKSKPVVKSARDQFNSDKHALKSLSIEELTRIATGTDNQAISAATVLLEKWRATPAKIPKGFVAKDAAIGKGSIPTIQVILREALIAAADGDVKAEAVIKEARTEMGRRLAEANQKRKNKNSKLSSKVRLLVDKEERLFNGPVNPKTGIPEGTSAAGTEFLEMFTHRRGDIQRSLRTVMSRFLIMIDMDANSEFLGTKFLDSMTLMDDLEAHWGNIGDPNTPYAKDMVNEIDPNAPETKKFVNDNRKNIVSLTGTNPEMVRDGIRGIARLALRTQAIPSSSKTAILDIYRVQSDAMKKRIKRRVGSAASEHQEMEYFFTESFIHFLSGRFPYKDGNIFTGLTSKEADEVIDIFDDVRDSVKYMTDGIVDKHKLDGIFDELAYAEPLGANQIRIQRSDAVADTMLRGIFPAMKDEMVASYLSYLSKTNPTRHGLLMKAASGHGLKPNGELQIFFHSSPNGGALDRSNNPILRQSRDGQHGRGTYMTTSADVGYDAFALRPTYQAKKTMVDKLAADQGIEESSLTYQRVMKDLEDLHKAQQDSSTSAGYLMKAREQVNVIEAKISRLMTEQADDSLLAQAELDLDKQLDVLDIMNDNYVELDMDIAVLHKNLKSSIGYKPDPVMIPLILKADRVAMFDSTMHRPDSDIVSQMLGRIKQLESKVVDPTDTQQTILNGAEGGIAEQIAERLTQNLNIDHSITGQSLYETMVSVLAQSFPNADDGIPMAREFIDDILESLGYEAKVGSTQNTLNTRGKDGELISSETKSYKETVVFDSRNTNHLASDLFDPESSMLYSEPKALTEANNPNFSVLTAAINSEGNINHRGWAGAVSPMEDQGAPPTLTSALVSIAKRRPLSEAQAKTLSQYGPKQFFSKGSDRLRSNGMKWLGDFIQPLSGSGFHEKQNSEMGRRIIPIIQKIKKLPDAKGVVGAWASKNNPLRTTQAPSVTRIVKTLRRPLGHESEKRLSPEEFAIYQDLRAVFSQEAISLKESGVLMGHIEDYFPQVWNKEAMLRDKDGVVSELARHLMRESITERNADITPQQAVEKAGSIFNRLTDDDGVYMPPPTGGRRDATGDHIDYQRMLRLDQYPDSLKSLEKYLENDLEGMMTKYFDLSTRRVAMANKFGTGSHGYYDYIYTVEHGLRGVVDLITKGKVFSREIIVPDAQGTTKATIENDLFTPMTQDPAQAQEIANQTLEIAKTQGPSAARDFLIATHPKATQAWEKRADAIANALAEFEGKQGMIQEKEYKFTQGLFNTTQRKPVSPQDTFFEMQNKTSKVLRSINAVSLLGWTTLTSLGDVALPLVRSGNFRAWANGLRKYAADPQYREDIQKVGVAIENLTHERLTGLVGADSTKATNAFFNFTMLTPWTNMNREMSGAVFHQAIISEQRTALTAKKGTRKYRTSMRFLNRYGLAEFGKEGAKDLNDPRILDNDSVREGMIRFSNESIFTPNSNDVPLWAQTPWGSIAFQLKSFPLMMQRLVLGEGGIVGEAFGREGGQFKGNPYPLLYALTIGAGFGMASMASKDVSQVRGGDDDQSSALRNRNLLKSLGYDKKIHGDENDFAGWYLDGLIQMGGLGLLSNMLYDSAQQLDNGAYGQMRVASTVFGPSVGLFMSGYNVAAGGWDAAGDAMGNESTNSKERQGIRELASRVPVLGGIKGLREGVVDTLAGESEVGQSKSTGGFGSSGFGSSGFGSSDF
jgi:hypothetical protein